MGHHETGRPIPRGILLGAAALLTLTIAAAGGARLLGAEPAASPDIEALERRLLRFDDGANGTVIVTNAADGRVVDVLPSGSNGFVRGLMRGLARERKSKSIDSAPPFELTRWSDGRLSRSDPATGRFVALNAFGGTNVAAFGRFLEVRADRP